MDKHTPGPWVIQQVVGRSDFEVFAWSKAVENKFLPRQLRIASIPNGWYEGNGRLFNELTANASLIAAAPELLEAARAAIAYDDAIHECANDPARMASFCTAEGDDLDTLYNDWIRKATEAVAKATEA